MARISKARQEEIRKTIVEEARALFFSKGFDKTSTKEIAKKVGIAEGTLFNYFKDKNDLFLVAIASEFDTEETEQAYQYSIEDVAPVILFNFLSKTYKPFMKLPKSLIIESGLAMVNVGKKHLPALKKLMEMDFKYMEKCEILINELKDNGLFIEETDTRELTENIFSVFLFEIFLFAYEKDMTHADFQARFQKKITSVCKGYLKTV